MKVEQLDVHRRSVGEPRNGGMLTESLIIREPHSAGKMAIGSQDEQLVLHKIFPAVRKVRDQDEGKDGKGLHPRSDVLDASPLFFWLGSQHQSTIEQKLGLRLSLHQVDRQQIAQVDVLACHNLGDKLSWDRRKTGTNDERLVQ